MRGRPDGLLPALVCVLVCVLSLARGPGAAAEPMKMGGEPMKMASHTLLLAQLDGAQVVPSSASQGTGTGAFLLDPARHALTYDLTYHGLESGGARSIALRNFGRGANGAELAVLCGEGVRPCPAGPGATISGTVDRIKGRAFDNRLVSELDSERVYVEIVGGGGKPEIRGQLAPNDAMVPVSSYVARLVPAEGTKSAGSGTAVVSEVFLPGGKVSVFYAATVTGTASEPVAAGVVGVPIKPPPKPPAFLRLPALKLRPSRAAKNGASLSGSYETDQTGRKQPLVTRLLGAGDNKAVDLVVATGRFRAGELRGVLEPVR
jgi:hypothetical protein